MASNYPPGVTGGEDYFYPPDYGELVVYCPGCDEQMEYEPKNGEFVCTADEEACGHAGLNAADEYHDQELAAQEDAAEARYELQRELEATGGYAE